MIRVSAKIKRFVAGETSQPSIILQRLVDNFLSYSANRQTNRRRKK